MSPLRWRRRKSPYTNAWRAFVSSVAFSVSPRCHPAYSSHVCERRNAFSASAFGCTSPHSLSRTYWRLSISLRARATAFSLTVYDATSGIVAAICCVAVGHRLTTTVVGSYPQPSWLIDRERLSERLPPRVRAAELWRVPEPSLEEAQDDATRISVQDMERAGIDIVTDGEMRRESYSNRFATALDGVDLDQPGVAIDRTGNENPVPRVVGPIRRTRPVEVRDVEHLRRLTERRIKITVP